MGCLVRHVASDWIHSWRIWVVGLQGATGALPQAGLTRHEAVAGLDVQQTPLARAHGPTQSLDLPAS